MKLDGRAEAKLIALACSDAPDGHEKWSLRMLADKLVELDVVDSIPPEIVRQYLKNDLNLWQKKCVYSEG